MPAAVLSVVIAAAAAGAFIEIASRGLDPRDGIRPASSEFKYHAPAHPKISANPLPDQHARMRDTQPSSADLLYDIERGLFSSDAFEREQALAKLPALLAVDAAAAARLLEQFDSGPPRDELRRQLASAWAAADIQGAMRWSQTLARKEERASAQADIVAQVAKSDPAKAVSVSDAFSIGRDDGTVEHTVQLWATERLPDALAWIRAQPAGADRDQLLARIALVQAETEPAGAAQLVTDLMTVGPMQDNAVLSIVQEWALRDPTAAEAWVTQMPPSALHTLASNQLARLAHHRAMYGSSD